jgi:hypothetical protein
MSYVSNLLTLTTYEIECIDENISFLILQQKRLCIKLMLGIGYQKDEWLQIVIETLRKMNFQVYFEQYHMEQELTKHLIFNRTELDAAINKSLPSESDTENGLIWLDLTME